MLAPFRRLPIPRQLTLISLLSGIVALVMACAAFMAYDLFTFRQVRVNQLSTAAQMVGFHTATALTGEGAAHAQETLRGLVTQPHILAACLYDSTGRVFAAYTQEDVELETWPPVGNGVKFSPGTIELFHPIGAEGKRIGTLYLLSDQAELWDRLRADAAITGAVLLASILISWALAAKLQGLVSRPLSHLAGVVERVRVAGDYSQRATHDGEGEIGRLIDGFNAMLAQIQARDAELQATHADLEKRVEERTAQLRLKSAEREQAEAALRTSENFLHSLLENLPIHLFRKDGAGRITFANRLFCDRYQRSLPDVIGRTVADFLPADQAERHRDIDRQIMASGRVFETIEAHPAMDGGITYMQVISVPVFDHGACIGVQSMLLDITQRQRAETQLAEASGLLDAMLENSPDFIYFKDRESRFVRASDAFVRRFKLASGDALRGKTDFDFFSAEHAQPAFDDEQEIIRTGQPIVGKLEKETAADGSVNWALTTKMPWRDGTGAIIGTFGISKDITALKEAETRLAYERDQLRALLASSPDTIYFKDLASKFVRVSHSKVRQTLARLPQLRERRDARGAEIPEEDLLNGLSDFDTYNGPDAQRAYDDEQEIIRTGKPLADRLEKQTYLDGCVRWSLTNKMPWHDREGRIIGTFGTSKDITPLKEAEAKLEQMHRQLLEVSRHAGMAEVATGVLHNVGNVLNSVNVSATLVMDRVRESKIANLARIGAMLRERAGDLPDFLTRDPRGQRIPPYLGTLADEVTAERQVMLEELEHLRKNIEHIKEIVAMQQSYARVSGVLETVPISELIDDALRMNTGALTRHGLELVRDYGPGLPVTIDRHKMLQILVNLIRNAKHACDDSGRTDKRLTVKVTHDAKRVRVAVIDNGVGIPPENLTRIFAHGFTTRKEGHGFGLHSGALAAKELGGSLTAHSDGPGKGATFVLELPLSQETPPS